MSTTVTVGPNPAPEGAGAARRHAKIVKRGWMLALALAMGAFVLGALVTFGWMVNETRFERPAPEFDAFEGQLENLPGVAGVDKERWVEAPTFSNPTSWMSVTVDEAGLPGLLDAACSTDYPDPVTWAIRVQTPEAAEVTLHATPADPSTADAGGRCPDFGFDAARIVDELDRVAPGLAIQPAVWENDRFTLVTLEEEVPAGFTHLLPLVEHADELLAAAGLDANAAVEINSANLGLVLAPGESDGYLALLTELAEHGVVSYWADGGTPIDGVEKVQIVAPAEQHNAIEESIRSSGLHIADLPVRFIEH